MKSLATSLLAFVVLFLVLSLFACIAQANVPAEPRFYARTGYLSLPLVAVDEQPAAYYRVDMQCDLQTSTCHIDYIEQVCDGFSPVSQTCLAAQQPRGH
jgi:hypothetical protein